MNHTKTQPAASEEPPLFRQYVDQQVAKDMAPLYAAFDAAPLLVTHSVSTQQALALAEAFKRGHDVGWHSATEHHKASGRTLGDIRDSLPFSDEVTPRLRAKPLFEPELSDKPVAYMVTNTQYRGVEPWLAWAVDDTWHESWQAEPLYTKKSYT